MKVCMAVFAYSPHTLGGAVVYCERIARGLSAGGDRVSVLTINPAAGVRDDRDGEIRVHRFHPLNTATFHDVGSKPFPVQAAWTLLDIYNPWSSFRCREFLARERPDVVHVHTPLDLTLSVFSACKALRIPVVMTVHEYLLLCRRNILVHGDGRLCSRENVHPLCRVYRSLSRAASGSARCVIAPSRHVMERITGEGFFPLSRRHILPYGVPVPASAPAKDIPADEFRVLYCGSLTRHKGVHVLIRAFRGISDARFRLTIVGEGIFGHQLRSEARGDGRISFHGLEKPEEMSGHYARSHLLVVPSLWEEALGIVNLEAFAAGIPVVASRAGGIPEAVKDGYNGVLFEPGDETRLREILEGLAAAPEELALLGANARTSALGYELGRHCGKLREIYKEAI